jgi:MoxR-like ATPase
VDDSGNHLFLAGIYLFQNCKSIQIKGGIRPMSIFIQLLREKTGEKDTFDYSTCSKLIRELLQILNSKEKGKIKIVGQEEMNRRLVSALILDEHVLLEGLPGVGKTRAVKNLAAEMCLFFNRVQFIPDMQPSDLIGRRDIIPKGENNFHFQWKDGPLFANLILADEINRAPSKVQAALLEAMGEKQITPFGMEERIILHQKAKEYLEQHTPPPCFNHDNTINFNHKHSTQFSVFATMNPIEIEGTYPLSEAQLDRFCFKTIVNYPDYKDLTRIADKVFQTQTEIGSKETDTLSNFPGQEDFIFALYFLHHCRRVIFAEGNNGNPYKHITIPMIEKIARIIYFSNYKYSDDTNTFVNDPEQLRLQMNFRDKDHMLAKKLKKNSIFRYIESGSSPRGVESLIKASLCEAFFDGAPLVEPQHIKRAAYDVLRHRIRLKIQAKTQNITPLDIIEILLNTFLDGDSND